jgi:hypothetical protein
LSIVEPAKNDVLVEEKGKVFGSVRFRNGIGLKLGLAWFGLAGGGWLEASRAKAKEARGGGPCDAERDAANGGTMRSGGAGDERWPRTAKERVGWSSDGSSRCRDRNAEEEEEEDEEEKEKEEEEKKKKQEDQRRKRKGGGLAAR